MAGHSSSKSRLCPTRAAVANLLLAIAALCGPGAAHAAAQAPALALELRTRGPAQPGSLIIATIVAPADASAVSLAGLGAEWTAYRTADGQWRALIGIDLETRPGTYEFVARSTGPVALEQRERIPVAPRQFRRRVLRVAPEYVNPPAETLERIRVEADLTRDAYARTDSEAGWKDGFIRPVAEAANSSFGTRSVFNGEARSPHAGTDFMSPAGTPIHAPAGGRVVLARNLFFTGNTVIIDHGLGVFSMLAHLSRIDVVEQHVVAADDVVGAVGATGRVTGAHLHWALRVGTARVDALGALALLPRVR